MIVIDSKQQRQQSSAAAGGDARGNGKFVEHQSFTCRQAESTDSTRNRKIPTSRNAASFSQKPVSRFALPAVLIQECRRLKSQLTVTNEKTGLRNLLFVSAQAGEGTSTIVSALAQVLAEGSRQPVLLIDGNFRNPSLHQQFKLPLENGFAELVMYHKTLRETMRAAGVPRLYLLTAGQGVNDPLAFLALPEVTQLLLHLKPHFAHILIDAPPASIYPDAFLWGKIVDGVALVLRPHHTRAKVAEAITQEFIRRGCHLLGVILNRRRYFIPRWIYQRI